MVPPEVQPLDEVGSSVVCTICGVADSTLRRLGRNSTSDLRTSSDPEQADVDNCDSQDDTQGQEQVSCSKLPTHRSSPDVSGHVPGGGVRVSAGRMAGNGDPEPSECPGRSRRANPPESNVESGERIAASHQSSPESKQSTFGESRAILKNEWEALIAAGDPDFEPDVEVSLNAHHSMCRERKAYHQCLTQLQQRLDKVKQQHIPRSRNRAKLFEVFCGPNSRLTNQISKMGHHAIRFALPQTDLMTSEGQEELFQQLERYQPDHVWFSPVCGPWSAWSNLNQSKSCEAWEVVQDQRIGNMGQLALGTILLRYQRASGKHFHWEQPQRSNMFRTPLLQEVYCHTLASEFDMCTVGDLRDPENGKPMKKGMTVLTTSEAMQKTLHGRKCHQNHDHQPLEGTTKYQGERISRTKFSEAYPRKFVRCIAQVLCRNHQEIPVNSEQVACATENHGPPAKKPRLSALRSAATPKARREFETPPSKRFRIWGKGNVVKGDNEQEEQWKAILECLKPQLPRVGKREVDSPEIRQQVEKLIQPKQLHSLVGGKGLNRTTAPLSKCLEGEAPFRMLVFQHRDTGKIEGVGQWEQWDKLPKRKIVRTGYPSSVAITVFAANPPNSDQQSAPQGPEHQAEPSVSPISPLSEQVVNDDSSNSVRSTTEDREKLVGHGPLFQQLPKEDQQLLMKIHKNAGHPGADKLAYLLRQQGFRSEVVAAVPDMCCDTCEATRGPKISRPSAIHSPCDFNDSISADGYTWTSKAGKLYHFYHVIDYSTNFHVAKYAPNRSTENAIQVLQQAWLTWAGSPNELVIDAASELNSEVFTVFTQRNNIKCTTISTEAHWQNGRAERHGAVLGNMLTKYDLENPIVTGDDLEQALIHCTQAKNSLSIRKGYPPQILVLGKSTRLPGSVCSDHQLPAHALADSETCHGLVFRQQLANRELARKAFHAADNDQALRRAILRRSRPSRRWYQQGEWVMIWVGGNNPGWRGPMKVVVQESQQTIWVTQHGKLYRPAPEHVRPITSIESHNLDPQSAPMPTSVPRSSADSQNRGQEKNIREQTYRGMTKTHLRILQQNNHPV